EVGRGSVRPIAAYGAWAPSINYEQIAAGLIDRHAIEGVEGRLSSATERFEEEVSLTRSGGRRSESQEGKYRVEREDQGDHTGRFQCAYHAYPLFLWLCMTM